MKYWIISAMDTVPKEGELVDVVSVVHWRRDAEEIDGDKTYYGDIYGAMGCSAPDPMAFVPYADLTFEQVCSWLEANLDVAALDANLDQQIENQKNPPIVQLPLPWVPAPVVEQSQEASVEQQAPTEETPTETPSNSL